MKRNQFLEIRAQTVDPTTNSKDRDTNIEETIEQATRTAFATPSLEVGSQSAPSKIISARW